MLGGPTAVGKTSVALKLAESLGTEILSADSRQCYRELNIGTAKPDAAELQRVHHHFINSHSIRETVSAGDYYRYAREVMARVFSENDHLVMAGGTGLYVRAALEGIDEMPQPVPELRHELNNWPLQKLQKELRTLDPDYAAKVDMNNPQRLVRALEICKSSGQPYSSFLNQPKDTLPYEVVRIALDMDRGELYTRINRRVDEMVQKGLVDEVRSVQDFRDHYALKTVGYSEIFNYLDGRCTLEEAVVAIKQNTRRYAKRQLTWFRKNDEYTWFHPENGREIVQFVKENSH